MSMVLACAMPFFEVKVVVKARLRSYRQKTNRAQTRLMLQFSGKRFVRQQFDQSCMVKMIEFCRVAISQQRTSNTKTLLVAVSLSLIAGSSFGAHPLKITSEFWSQLAEEDRNTLIKQYAVEILPLGSVGKIIDAQIVNESTPGTNTGTLLGGAVGSAAYIDRSFRGNNNYSAMTHLGVSLLGMVVGASLDRPATPQFHTRYSIKMLDGSLIYHDVVSSNQFRKSIGECVSVMEWQSLNIHLCEDRTEYLKTLLPKNPHTNGTVTAENLPVASHHVPAISPKNNAWKSPAASKGGAIEIKATASQGDSEVFCKIGSTMPIKVLKKDCDISNGVILP